MSNTKKTIPTYLYLFIIASISYGHAYAQDNYEDFRKKMQEQFQQFKEQKHSEFEAFRDSVNREYAEFMSREWTEFKTEAAMPVPPSPEPPKPVVADPDKKPSVDQLAFESAKPQPPVPPQPTPLLPEPEIKPQPEIKPEPEIKPQPDTKPQPDIKPTPDPKPQEKPTPAVSFDFYGKQCSVQFDDAMRFSLKDNGEKSVANAWKRLSNQASIPTVNDCVNLRKSLRLSDWGYLRLVEKLSEAAFPGKKDEATLLKMFLLTQSGYKVRIGNNGSRLIILIPSDDQIYNYSYVNVNRTKYYILDSNRGPSAIRIYDQEFPREQMFSLVLREQPALPTSASTKRHLNSTYGQGISTDVAVNKNLIAFYNEYPLSNRWDANVYASLSDSAKAQLYPALRTAINGKSQLEAANILLRFVQTAFDYKTDEEQFGYERPLFADETLYYPYSDCEDRAILYSVLVRELLGLKTVLVHYPGHLATAVRFDADVNGDYFNLDGEKYVVCDPTYINSNVGMAMPSYKKAQAEIVKL